MANVISSLNGDPGEWQESRIRLSGGGWKGWERESPDKRGFISDEEKNTKWGKCIEQQRIGEVTEKELLLQLQDGCEWSYCENKERISERWRTRLQPDRASGTAAGQTAHKACCELDTVEQTGRFKGSAYQKWQNISKTRGYYPCRQSTTPQFAQFFYCSYFNKNTLWIIHSTIAVEFFKCIFFILNLQLPKTTREKSKETNLGYHTSIRVSAATLSGHYPQQ